MGMILIPVFFILLLTSIATIISFWAILINFNKYVYCKYICTIFRYIIFIE